MRRQLAIVLVVAVVGCGSSDVVGTKSDTYRSVAYTARSATTSDWLPLGTRVPVGDDLPALPEPYTFERYGPALASTVRPITGRLDSRAIASHRSLRAKLRPGARAKFPPPVNGNRGYWLDQATKPWWGVYTVNDISTDLIPDSGFVYAPTTLPPGQSCLEMVMAHWQTFGTQHHELWTWDWCKGQQHVGVLPDSARWDLTNASFASNYVRTYNGRSTIAVAIVTPNTGSTPGQCWYFLIYNFNLGGYQQLYYSCGTSRLNDWYPSAGWQMWEEWGFLGSSTCPSVASTGAASVSFADPTSSSWTAVTNFPSDHSSLNTGHYCWNGGPYTWTSPVSSAASLSWRAN